MSIEEIMSDSIVSVELDDSLKVVKEIFDNTNFHHLLVVASGKLFGVISDRDLLKALSPNIGTKFETEKDSAALNKRVHQIVTRKPMALEKSAGIYDAIHLFNNHKISCIPIIDDQQKPVGVVSWRDILKFIERARENRINKGHSEEQASDA